jgi:hypothetical protein
MPKLMRLGSKEHASRIFWCFHGCCALSRSLSSRNLPDYAGGAMLFFRFFHFVYCSEKQEKTSKLF